ncbi:MAG TPA: pantetheine-phosphate adenylyltransferase [Myxococcota bacterium]
MATSPSRSAAIYPGSFDPLTNGHIDIIKRGVATFDRVIVAVANNPQKSPLFTVPERIALARKCLGDNERVEIDTFDGLIVEYAQKKGVHVLLRGLRAVSDFEYEFQLASMNRKLAKDVETVFMMTSEESFYLSSRLVREVASFGGNVSEMVPAPVYDALTQRFHKKKAKPS